MTGEPGAKRLHARLLTSALKDKTYVIRGAGT
jgi:hypothetical protein